MKLVALTAILASLLAAPAIPLVLGDAPADRSLTASTSAATHAGDALAGPIRSARLVFVVQHAGVDSPALARIEGPAVVHAIPLVLRQGNQTVFDEALPLGKYSLTLQQLMTTGMNAVDLRDCPDGTTRAVMKTRTELTSFAIEVQPEACLA